MASVASSFDMHGPSAPASPVILSVPHAGRDYPLALRAALRVPLAMLQPLEDRYVDAVAIAARGTATMLVQRRARAWIDLNRGEHERDPQIDSGADSRGLPLQSAKLRGGLGLIPRRLAGVGEIWRRKLDGEEVMARITGDHRPYHAALATLLERTRARFGIAILLDIHSMPPLANGLPLVFGDHHGRSAATRFVQRLEAVAHAAGLRSARNAPYAGGHILDCHADPHHAIHAIQIEIDRTAYLDPALDRPGPGAAAITAVLRRMIDAISDEAFTASTAIAAE